MKTQARLLAAVVTLALWHVGTPDARADDTVKNPSGVSVKVITTKKTQIFTQADKGSDSQPVDMFTYWYVLPPDPQTKTDQRTTKDLPSLTQSDFYRVASGDLEASARGWIHKDDVVEWHHREALQFSEPQGRERARFYTTKEDAEKALKKEEAKPVAEEPEGVGNQLLLIPILGLSETTAAGDTMPLYHVAFVAGDPAATGTTGGGGGGGTVTRDDVLKKSTVDVVFVIDTTASMGPSIERVRKSVASVSQQLGSKPALKARLRFGLVAYRDTIEDMGSMEYLTKVFCSLEEGANHDTFLQRIAGVQEARVGSGDYPEDGLAGLVTAMDTAQLKWNPVAWKIVVMVGDASLKSEEHPDPSARHTANPTSIASVKTMAQPASAGTQSEMLKSGYVITAVHVLHPDTAADHPTAAQQFNELVSGRQYQGKYIESRDDDATADFTGGLVQFIQGNIDAFDEAILKGLDPGTIIGKRKDRPENIPYPLLKLLESTETGNAAAQSFRSGYATERDVKGDLLFKPAVFVRRGSLKLFNSGLEFVHTQLESQGDPGSRSVEALVKSMKMMAASISIAEDVSEDMPLDEFLRILGGFPVKSPIFQVTPKKLVAMTAADYNDWVRGVQAVTDSIRVLIEKPEIWYRLHRDEKEVNDHAFIPVSDLP